MSREKGRWKIEQRVLLSVVHFCSAEFSVQRSQKLMMMRVLGGGALEGLAVVRQREGTHAGTLPNLVNHP